MGKISRRPASISKISTSFAGSAKLPKFCMGPTMRKARADVVQGSCNGGEVRHHIKAVQTDEQEGYHEDEEIRRPKHVGGADGLVVEQLAVHADGATTCGCSAGLSSLPKVLPRMRKRLTLMPPPVLPAQAPMNMSTTRISLERVGHRSKSQLEKPVVVMMEPT